MDDFVNAVDADGAFAVPRNVLNFSDIAIRIVKKDDGGFEWVEDRTPELLRTRS